MAYSEFVKISYNFTRDSSYLILANPTLQKKQKLNTPGYEI